MPDLLPCPFCGREPYFVDGEDDDGRFVAVGCDCGVGTGKYYPVMGDAQPSAANEWNRRTPSSTTKAAADVLAERRRQIEEEGWTPQHDDNWPSGTLSLAAACYAMPKQDRQSKHGSGVSVWRALWPFDGWWKPSDRRRDLVKAGALILAEIERLDRAAELGASDA